jgi:hypothetical protein
VPSTSGGSIHSRAVLCHSPNRIGKILRNSSRRRNRWQRDAQNPPEGFVGSESKCCAMPLSIAIFYSCSRICAKKLRYFAITRTGRTAGLRRQPPSLAMTLLVASTLCHGSNRAHRHVVVAAWPTRAARCATISIASSSRHSQKPTPAVAMTCRCRAARAAAATRAPWNLELPAYGELVFAHDSEFTSIDPRPRSIGSDFHVQFMT